MIAFRYAALMASIEHESVVELFRGRPELAPSMMGSLLGVTSPEFATAQVSEAGAEQLTPTEHRADLVICLRDESGAAVQAIVVEVQRRRDPEKSWIWPAYAANIRAKRHCPTTLLVVAVDAGVAAWANEAIQIGPGMRDFKPLVLGPSVLPAVTEAEQAVAAPELAILSAMAHGNSSQGLAVVQASLAAINQLGDDHAAAYFHAVYNGLGDVIRAAVEQIIMQQAQTTEPLPPFLQQFVDRGISEGETKGKAAGEAIGETKGRAHALIRLLTRAGLPLTDADRQRITNCQDPDTLDRWLDNAWGAKSASDVFN